MIRGKWQFRQNNDPFPTELNLLSNDNIIDPNFARDLGLGDLTENVRAAFPSLTREGQMAAMRQQ